MKLFIIFSIILRHAFVLKAFTLKGGDWLIKSNLAIGDITTLQCPFTRQVNCQWRTGDQMVPNSMRYRYLTGNGSNTTDCSIEITHSKRTDLYFWTCDIYELSDNKRSIATLRYYLTKGTYEVHALVEVQYVTPRNVSDGNIEIMCVSNTYGEKCFYIYTHYDSYLTLILQETAVQLIQGNNCTQERSRSYHKGKTCGLERDVQEPRLINEDTVEFECSNIVSPVNCTWKYNQEQVPVERIKYRSKSIDSTDCTIHVKIKKSTDEVKGLWECLMQKQNSTQILYLYEAFTYPGTKVHLIQKDDDDEQIHSTIGTCLKDNLKIHNTIHKMQMALQSVESTLHFICTCVLLFVIVFFAKIITNVVCWTRLQFIKRGITKPFKKKVSRETVVDGDELK